MLGSRRPPGCCPEWLGDGRARPKRARAHEKEARLTNPPSATLLSTPSAALNTETQKQHGRTRPEDDRPSDRPTASPPTARPPDCPSGGAPERRSARPPDRPSGAVPIDPTGQRPNLSTCSSLASAHLSGTPSGHGLATVHDIAAIPASGSPPPTASWGRV